MSTFETTAPQVLPEHVPQKTFGSPYRLEAIMRLRDEAMVGGEVLHHGRLPSFGYAWRRWYARLGRLQFEYGRNYRLFVNLDTDHILQSRLLAGLLDSAANRTRLVLEWTEKPSSQTALEHAAGVLKELRAEHGLSICVDDFGAGMDGIRRLQLCNPDIVKIDGNLLHAARGHAPTRVLYRNIASLLKDAGATTVAEWIETPEDLEFARDAGVDLGQGYRWPHAQGSI